MYETLTGVGWSVSIISDIDTSKIFIDHLLPAMVKGSVSSGIQSWLTTLPSLMKPYSKTVFMSLLVNAGVIYYTGHGHNQSLMAPDDTHYPWVSFCRNKICIFDCCYTINETMWVVSNVHEHRIDVQISDIIDVADSTVILLPKDCQTVTNTCGSDFTRCIADHIKSKKSLWQSLCDCKILSMYPLMRWIPRMLYNDADVYVSSDVVYVKIE